MLSMSRLFVKNCISFLIFLKNKCLDNPYIFNNIRSLIAGNQENTKQFVKKFLEIYKCKSVIDICSGTGDFSDLATKNTSYLGVDINQNFIKYSKNKYKMDKNKFFKVGDMLNPKEFGSSKFDAVLLISTLHHFSDSDLQTLLTSVSKIVNKIIIVADIIPNPPGLLKKIAVKLDQGRYIRSERDKIKILEKHFKIIESTEIKSRLAIQYGIICKV